MRTTEEIIEKIHEMMEIEEIAFEGCEAIGKRWESFGEFEMAKEMKTNAKRHAREYNKLADLIDWINEK